MEGKHILSLVSENRGRLEVLCKESPNPKIGAQLVPELFSKIRVVLQQSGEGFYRLRSFETLHRYPDQGKEENFLLACLLARAMNFLLYEAEGESSFFALWKRFYQEPSPSARLADLLFAAGLWPMPDEKLEQLTPEQRQSVKNLFITRTGLAGSPTGAKLLARHFITALPDELRADSTFSRIAGRLLA